jgi:hypothetical protein
MRTTTTMLVAATTLALATAADAAPRPKMQTRPIFEVMEFGTTRTILRHGTLELRARCDRDPPETQNFDVVALEVNSRTDWVLTTETGFQTIPANDPRTLLFFARPSGPAFETASRNQFGNDFDVAGASALGADGTYLSVAADTLSFGVEVFGHDCLIIGTATLIKGRLP